MHLYLLRHADADTEALHDDDRALSEKGISQANRVARFCRVHDILPTIIAASPIRRADQTARIVGEHLCIPVDTAAFLSCGMLPETALAELKTYRAHESVMLVGHEPDFSRFAGYLLGIGIAANLRVRKASLTSLRLEALRPATAELDFSLPCKLM